MRWPWTGSSDDTNGTSSRRSWKDHAYPSNWTWPTFSDPGTLLPGLVFTVTTVSALRIYKAYFRRIPNVNHIKPGHWRSKSLFGRVTSVGDADNFRIFHTPGGRLAGWGWLPWKKVPTTREGLLNNTIHVRIAGIDAPELAHWGREAQPYSKEAHDWLINYISNRRVRAHIFKRDQYDRVVAQVIVRKRFLRRDVGLEMIKSGLAGVYEAKSGSEFGDFEQKYRDAEEKAKASQVGMWAKPTILERLIGESPKVVESPREYKTRHAAGDKTKKSK